MVEDPDSPGSNDSTTELDKTLSSSYADVDVEMLAASAEWAPDVSTINDVAYCSYLDVGAGAQGGCPCVEAVMAAADRGAWR